MDPEPQHPYLSISNTPQPIAVNQSQLFLHFSENQACLEIHASNPPSSGISHVLKQHLPCSFFNVSGLPKFSDHAVLV
jgi:hypothetical protein